MALLASACTDPEPVALAACQALPQLSTDAAGIEGLRPHLDPRELELLEASAPTLGMEAVGSEGLAQLRSSLTCTVDQVDSAGSGRWAVKLTRSQPKVGPDGSIGENQDVALDWQVVDGKDGPYVESGLRFAVTKRESLAKALEEKDYMRVAGGWRGIVQSFPDPVLTVDIAAAETLDKGWSYRKQIVPVGAGALDAETLALQVQNTGEETVAKAVINLKFTHGGQEETVRLVSGEMAPGATVELQGTSEGPMSPDVGGFDAEVIAVELAPAG